MQFKKKRPGAENAILHEHCVTPEDPLAIISRYGTYNIQPTADCDNTFPAIAHGLPKNTSKTDTDVKKS